MSAVVLDPGGHRLPLQSGLGMTLI